MKAKADGKLYRWETVTLEKRRKLKPSQSDRSQEPWTKRDGIRLRGFSVQLSPVNFIHELLNVHFMKDCDRHQRSYDSPAPDYLMVDVRQSAENQLASGSVTMMTSTKLYVYRIDRCAAPPEHMIMNGWSLEDIDYKCVNANTWDEIADPSAKKRGKARLLLGRSYSSNLLGMRSPCQAWPCSYCRWFM